jgi:nucleoside-triphosphatase THEP1
LLVITEIGPLEMEQGQGLTNVLDRLRRAAYRLALVSVRPALVQAVAAELNGSDVSVIVLEEGNRDRLPGMIVAQLEQGGTGLDGRR